jgi:hypothetical protein
LGSDLHISQGLEVIDWQANDKSLRLTLARPGRVHGRIDLAIPNPIESARLDGVLIPWETLGEGMYSFELKFKQRASLEINYR